MEEKTGRTVQDLERDLYGDKHRINIQNKNGTSGNFKGGLGGFLQPK